MDFEYSMKTHFLDFRREDLLLEDFWSEISILMMFEEGVRRGALGPRVRFSLISSFLMIFGVMMTSRFSTEGLGVSSFTGLSPDISILTSTCFTSSTGTCSSTISWSCFSKSISISLCSSSGLQFLRPSHFQILVHMTPLWKHSQYFLRQ